MLFIISLILRILYCFNWMLEPVSDFGTTLKIAQNLLNSDLSQWKKIIGTGYTVTWPAHIPFISYEWLILKIFNENIIGLYICNILFSSFSVILVALISMKFFGKDTGISIGFLLSICPAVLFYTSLLTNQHISTFLFLLFLYFFICKPIRIKGNYKKENIVNYTLP